MLRRLTLYFAVFLFVLVGIGVGGILAFWTGDIERATLERFYVDESSAFAETASGGRIHYRDRGPRDGAAILLVHGTGSSLHAWDPWVRLLSGSYRIVTLDLPAHGLTGATPGGDYGRSGMIEAIERVVQVTGLDRFVIGGNSMGGEMAIAYALAHIDRIRGLILVDSGGLGYIARDGGEVERSVPLVFRLASLPLVNHLVAKVTPRALIEDGLRNVFVDDSRVDDLMIDRYWHLLRLEGSRKAMLERFVAGARERDALAVERLDMPALVLWGEQDRMIPLYYGEALAERLPDATLVTYADAGHVPMEDIPERSAADVRRFLSTLRDRDIRAASVRE